MSTHRVLFFCHCMELHQYLQRLLPEQSPSELHISSITGDASNRRYFRLTDISNSATTVLCIDPGFRGRDPRSYPFLVVRDLLAENGIRTPEIFRHDSETGAFLLEDCGTDMLQDHVTAFPDDLGPLYDSVIDTLVHLQSIRGNSSSVPFSLSFDREKLMFEFDFFITHALENNHRATPSAQDLEHLRQQCEQITTLLLETDRFVLNHRDFHCRNILVPEGTPVIIDFQDARMGLPQYDAVSLLRDSYLELPDQRVGELQLRHWQQLKDRGLQNTSFDTYLRLFDIMAFQRNVKALGTFFYQVDVLGNRSFAPYISSTLAYLPGYIERQKELQPAGNLILNLLDTYVS